jgi:hypothetical protein
VPVALGVGVALLVHLGKAGTRAAANVALAGIAAPVLSVVEDVTSVALVVAAVLLPALVLVGLGALALLMVLVIRRRRARERRAALPNPP